MAVKKQWIAVAGAGAVFFSISILACVAIIGVFAATSYNAYSNTGAVRSYDAPRMGTMDDVDRGGQLWVEVDGRVEAMPALKTDYDVDVRGDLVHVALTQTFSNPSHSEIHALYEFPLNGTAAVHDMTMIVGDRRIRAQIKEKQEATAVYEEAKAQGKKASLLVQQRPNVFTQHVANIGAGESVEIQIEYVHPIRKFEGRYELTLPLVVGPRFNPADLSANTLAGEQAETVHGTGTESYGNAPSSIDADRVSIRVRLDSPLPIYNLQSPSHQVVSKKMGPNDWTVNLAAGREVDNKHFELEWEPQLGSWSFDDGAPESTGTSSSWNSDLERGHVALWLEAPTKAPEHVMDREMVFLLDCSGSMYGAPMDASKAFMRKALTGLRPTDMFRVIRFSDTVSEFTSEPRLATPGNIEDAIAYVDQLEGSGGTMMSSGIKAALDTPGAPDRLRLVTFLTDGYIGNDFEILKLIDARIDNSRLYAIGVGTGVNTYLLDEIGATGRGFTRYIDPTEDVDYVASELAERLQSPVLTDIQVEWDEDVEQVYPVKIPDLFAGQSIRLVGAYSKPGATTVKISGMANGVRRTQTMRVHLTNQHSGQAIQQTWARARVKALMQDLLSNPERRAFGLNDEELKTAVTHTGLEYRLMTQWTAFVAVADVATNADPSGTREHAFKSAPVEGVSMGFVSGAPEPGTMGGLLVMGLGAWAARRRRKDDESTE